MTTLRVAAAQAESRPGDLLANVTTAAWLVEQAAGRGARVVVLPELFLTGYDPAVWRHEAGLTLDDHRLEPLVRAAAQHRLVVVASAAVRRAEAATTLSAVVVDAERRVTAPYDKQHLSGPERDFFTPGDHGASLVVDGWELGLGICYDGSFPEHARAAADDGASAYLCPAAFFAGGQHRRDLYFAARALDNGLYVVLAGLTGTCGDGVFTGGSAVYDPEGRALDRLGEEPGVVVADLDPHEVARVRDRHPMGRERLPSLGRRRRATVA